VMFDALDCIFHCSFTSVAVRGLPEVPVMCHSNHGMVLHAHAAAPLHIIQPLSHSCTYTATFELQV
jgi:hypothetical protein